MPNMAVSSAPTADALNAVRAKGGTDRGGRLDRAAHDRERGGRSGVIRPFAGDTAIFITPGYRFKAVDVMMTNFHLPRSTLFMLVVGVLRPRRDAARLCARDRSRAIVSIPMATRACCSRGAHD